MRIIAVICLALWLMGCTNAKLEHPSIVHSPGQDHRTHDDHDHDDHAHDDHDDHDHPLVLSDEQREELGITLKPVVAATGRKTGSRPGRVEADPDRHVMVSAQVTGVLQQLDIQVGTRVHAGQLVAIIVSPEVTALQTDFHEAEVEAELAAKELANTSSILAIGDDTQRPIEEARLELTQARAKREIAEATLERASLRNERLETLLEEGIASRQQVEESRAERRIQEAEVEQAIAAVKIAEQHLEREEKMARSELRVKAETFPAEARLARASERMEHARERLEQLGADPDAHDGRIVLTSPISGMVVERGLSRGELVSPGQAVVTVVDSSVVWVWVDLQRSDLDLVKEGDQIELALVEYPDRRAQGMVDFISPSFDPDSQTVATRMVLSDPPEGFKLGSFVTARLTEAQGESVPAIPEAAVQLVEGKTVVYTLDGEEFQRRSVELGHAIGEDLVSVGGLEVGESVVVGGADKLKSLDLADTIGGHSH